MEIDCAEYEGEKCYQKFTVLYEATSIERVHRSHGAQQSKKDPGDRFGCE